MAARRDSRVEVPSRLRVSAQKTCVSLKDHHAHLWGKSRTEYEDIYGPDSIYVVPIISEHYATREWTQWEIETAKREAGKRKSDFLLPIRLDDSRQFGLTDNHNYLGADNFTPRKLRRR